VEVDEASQTIRNHGRTDLTGLKVEAGKTEGMGGLKWELMFGNLFTHSALKNFVCAFTSCFQTKFCAPKAWAMPEICGSERY
jgi:hypothetical protein